MADNIYVTDSLTKTNQEIMYRGRQLRKDGRLWAVWSDAGKLKAKVRDGDQTTIIRSLDDLIRLVGGDSPPPPPPPGADSAAAASRCDSAVAGAAGGRGDNSDGFVPGGRRKTRKDNSARAGGGR